MISSGAMAAVCPAAGAFAARRSASVRSAAVQPLRANCVLPAPASTPYGLVRQTAARPAIFSVSRRTAVPLRCSAEPAERTPQSQGNFLADMAAALKSVMVSMAAAVVAAFSFAGAAMAKRAAAVPPPPPPTPIEASLALLTSNMSIDAKLQAMAATPSLALVPGVLSIALAILSMGLVLSICAAGQKTSTPHSRADAITESQDIDEVAPVAAKAAAAVESAPEPVDEATALRERLEATRERIKHRIASVTGVEVQDPPIGGAGAAVASGSDTAGMKSILTGTASLSSAASSLYRFDRPDVDAISAASRTPKAVPANPVEAFLAGDDQIATPSERLHRIDSVDILPDTYIDTRISPAKDFRASPAGAMLAGSSTIASKPSRKIHRFDALPKRASYVEAASVEAGPELGMEATYLASRMNTVQEHFPGALSAADFLFRLEMALCSYKLTGENSIAIVNLCRDEATNAVRHKIEELFPLSFNINGLGGGITCGVTGMGAGLSHSPICDAAGKPRYVFFSFPHIAINSKGELGALSRPGQDATSSACGALIAALGQLKAEGLESNIVKPGVHNADDPEYSILKQRIARRMLKEDVRPDNMNLVDITKIAERQISNDLEYLISKAVDPEKADYAIVTGVQIHNWGEEFDNEEPNVEFIAPTTVSVIINGERSDLDLSMMPALSPRMVRMLSNATGDGDDTTSVCSYTGNSTISDIAKSTMFAAHKYETKEGKEREERFIKFVADQQK